MGKKPFQQTCPICGDTATITRKWVRNRSGKRYDYVLYHHEGITHWLNQNLRTTHRLRKKEAQDKLVFLLNSRRFKQAIFTLDELMATLRQGENGLQHRQIRESLSRLVSQNLVESIRNGRKVLYINNFNPNRLYYVIKQADISLEDTKRNHTFEKHIFRFEILNDNAFPLQYIQYNTVGDDPRENDEVSFLAYDLKKKENARIHFIEDSPRRKRIIIEFATPILPRESRKLCLEYFWPVTSYLSSFTAPTPIKSLRFSLISKSREPMEVLRTSAQRTEIEDESEKVITTDFRNGVFIESFVAEDLPEFTVLQFKWAKSVEQEQEENRKDALKRLEKQ